MPKDETKKTKSARNAAWAVGVFFVVFILVLLAKRSEPGTQVIIGANKIMVMVAATEAERTKGLCCRDSLSAGQGMLFVYDKPGGYRYWMKDTLIPLDMIWIDSDKKIVHIEHSVQPGSYPKTYGSMVPAQFVLEVNAGYTAAHSIKLGDTAKF